MTSLEAVHREAWLAKLRNEAASVLAERGDLESILQEIKDALLKRRVRLEALIDVREELGAGTTDRIVAFGGLACAALGGVGLLAGGPVTWVVAAGMVGTCGGSGFAVAGGVQMWRHTGRLTRLDTEQSWLNLEIEDLEAAEVRVIDALEIQREKASIG